MTRLAVTHQPTHSLRLRPSAAAMRIALVTAFAASASTPAFAVPPPGALPTGFSLVSGTVLPPATVGNAMTIIQNSGLGVIDWSTFNIGSNASVTFTVPTAAAVTLNVVDSANGPSEIFGSISSIGTVGILNAAGMLFGPGSTINVGGLVASSLNLGSTPVFGPDILIDLDFNGASADGAVINRGSITTGDGGLVMIGRQVTNQGSILTAGGDALLIGADRGTVHLTRNADNGRIPTVDNVGRINALTGGGTAGVTNTGSGTITTQGGDIVMQAQLAPGLGLANVVNNSGLLVASGVAAHPRSGDVTLTGDGAGVSTTGTITAVGFDPGRDGDVTVSSDRDLDVGAIDAGDTGDVTLTAKGNITDANGAAANVTARTLTATTTRGVDLDTAVTNLTVASTGVNGDIAIDEADGLAHSDVTTQKGDITLTANGAVRIDNMASAGGGRITVTDATGDITVGSISAGDSTVAQNDVTITATAGAIRDDANDATADITGNDVTLTAGTGIGGVGNGSLDIATGGDLDMDVTGAGSISVAGDHFDGVRATTANGSITIDATNGSLNAINISSQTDDDANDIRLSALGIVTVGRVSAGGTAGDVTITAQLGSIVDDADDALADVVGDRVTLTAGGAIGGGASGFDTNANTLVLNTGAGSIAIDEINDATVNANSAGGIDIHTGGVMTVGSIVETGVSDVILTSDKSIQDGNGNAVNVTGGTLRATADRGIDLDTSIDTLIANVTGDGGIDVNNAGALSLASVTTANGAIDIKAGGDLSATIVSAGGGGNGDSVTLDTTAGDIILRGTISAAGDGDVTLTSRNGAISDFVNGTTPDITGDRVTLTAATGIGDDGSTPGSNGTIDTAANSLDLSVTGAGSIFLSEVDGVTLADVDTRNGAINIEAGGDVKAVDVASLKDSDGNDVNLVVHGILDVGSIVAGANNGEVVLTVDGAITDANGAAVNVAGSKLTANVAGGGISLDTDVRALVAHTTAAGNINIDEANAIDLTNVTAASGTVTVNAGGTINAQNVVAQGGTDTDDVRLTAATGNVTVGSVRAAGDGDVAITATSGAIRDDANDADPDVTGETVTLTALSGIGGGANGTLDTRADRLNLVTTGTGDIAVDEANDVRLTATAANGSIAVTSGGTLTVAGVTSTTDDDTNDIRLAAANDLVLIGSVSAGTTAGDVTLEATGGSILDNADDTTVDVAGDVVTLNAATAVGTSGTADGALDTQANVLRGTLTTAGLYRVSELDAVRLGGIDAGGGTVDITGAGTIDAASVSNAAAVILVATGATSDINAGDIAGDDVTLNAGGAITDGNGTQVNVTGSALHATAVTGISLDTAVATLDANVTGTGNLSVRDADALHVTQATTTDGDLTIVAGGTLDADVVGAATHIATLTSTGADINLGTATAATVKLNAGGGITDANGAAVNVVADLLALNTVTGADLDTTVNRLKGEGSGDLDIHNTTDLRITNLGITSGDIAVDADGRIVAEKVATDAGTVRLTANGATSNIAAGVIRGTNVFLTAGRSIVDGNAGDTNVVADSLTAVAANGVDLDTRVDNLTANVTGKGNVDIDEANDITLTSIQAADGSVRVDAGGDVVATSVVSVSARPSQGIHIGSTGGNVVVGLIDAGATGDVDVAATAGSIRDDGTANDATTDIVGENVTLTAATGIGTSAAGTIDTQAATLNLNGTGTGGIAVDQLGNAVLTAQSASGDIAVTASGVLTASTVTSGSGNIALTTTGAGNDLLVGAVSTTSDVTLTSAAGLVDGNGAGTVNVSGRNLTANAAGAIGLDTAVDRIDAHGTGAGPIAFNETDAVTLGSVVADAGPISVTAGGTITATGVTTGGTDADDVTLTSTGGDIVAGTIDAGVNGDVTLAAAAGQINDDGNAATRIRGGVLTASAGNGIGAVGGALGTNVAKINAAVTGGNIAIDELNAVTLASATSAGGNIGVTAGTTITAGNVNAGTGDVALTSTGGSIVDDGNGATLVSGNTLTAVAANGIDLDTHIARLSATVTGAGNVAVSDEGPLNVLDASTANGSIGIASEGALTATDVVATGGDVTLSNANGDMLVDGIQGGTVNLTSFGSIGPQAAGGPNVTATNLVANAGTGITLATEVTGVTAHVTGTGDVQIDDASAVDLTDVTAANGNVTATANGALTATSVVASGNATLTSNGGVLTATSVTATGGTANLTANGADLVAGSVSGGNVQLHADAGSITDANGAAVNVTSPGTLIATAANGIDLDTAVGTIDQTSTATGSVVIREADDVAIGTITGPTVNLTSGGAITDANGGASNIGATTLVAHAATGIDLDTQVDTLDATVTGAGDLNISDAGDLSIAAANAENGDVTLNVGNDLLILDDGVISADDGSVHITTGGGVQQAGQRDNAAIVAGNNLDITAGDNVGAVLLPLFVNVGHNVTINFATGEPIALITGSFGGLNESSQVFGLSANTTLSENVGSIQSSFQKTVTFNLDSSQFATQTRIYTTEGTGVLLPEDVRE